jgi:hypothetical protein
MIASVWRLRIRSLGENRVARLAGAICFVKPHIRFSFFFNVSWRPQSALEKWKRVPMPRMYKPPAVRGVHMGHAARYVAFDLPWLQVIDLKRARVTVAGIASISIAEQQNQPASVLCVERGGEAMDRIHNV